MVIDIGTSCVEYIVAAQVSPFVIPAVRVLRLTFLGCCYEITPSGFPAALIQTPAATDTTESAISTVESPRSRLCRASVSGNHQFRNPRYSLTLPEKSARRNSTTIHQYHTHRYVLLHFFFASSFLRGSSNSSSQHFLIRGGTSLLIHFQFAAATLHKLGRKKVRKKNRRQK